MRAPSETKLALAAFVVIAIGVSGGCNAILGNGYGVDPGVGSEGEGGPGGEGGGDGDGGSGDGSTTGDGSTNIDGNRPDGAGCPNGVCPTLLASAVGPQRLALSATGVYWASLAGIGRVDLDGNNPRSLEIAQAVDPNLKRGIAVDGVSAYVTMPGLAKGAAKCAADVSSCATGFIGSAGAASSIAVDATRVYVGIFDDQFGGGAGGIWQTHLDGTVASPYTMMTDKVLDLQIVGATTYFRTPSAVRSNSLTTMPVNVVNLGAELPLAFVVAGTRVFVATDMKHLQACTLSLPTACAGSVVALTTDAPTALAADTTHVYWAEGTAGGTVHRCNLPSCSNPLLIADGQASPNDIAVDGTSVYWANHGDAAGAGGAVMKLPK